MYFVAPNGDDANDGSLGAPWRTIQRATGLQPGATLFLRGGTYYAREISLGWVGTAATPITLRNFPGEQPRIDGGYQQFRTPGNQDWEVVNERLGLYKSVATFPNAGPVYGYLGEGDGGYQLVSYRDLETLASEIEDYNETPPYFYCGPGVHWHPGDQCIYVRLTHSRYQVANLQVPADSDPANVPLQLFPARGLLTFRSGAAHTVIDGIELHHGEPAIEVRSGAHDLVVRNCDLQGGRYEIIVREGANRLQFANLTVDGRFPPWVPRSDVKRPSAAPPAYRFQGAAIELVGSVDTVEITGCSFSNLFDGIDATTQTSNLHVHHCRFQGIRDDAMQLGSAGSRFDIHDNVVVDCVAGFSWQGAGGPPPGLTGTKFIHHNVFDTRRLHLYGRDDPQQLLPLKWRGPHGDGMATGRAFVTHDVQLITDPDPWRIYHNTILIAQDVDGGGAGHCYEMVLFDPLVPQAFLNNIVVQTMDHWVARSARAHDGSMIIDGNLYFRTTPNATADLFEDFFDGVQYLDFANIAQFSVSPMRALTNVYYAPGWDQSSIEANPQLDLAYRPAAGSPAATGALDLSGTGWPGTGVAVPWRGALAPR